MFKDVNKDKIYLKVKKKVKKLIKNIILKTYYIFTKVLLVQKDIIIFESNLGRNYTGNPRFIYEEMVSRDLDKKYRCYFILEDTATKILGSAHKVKKNSLKYFYVISVARYLVADSRQSLFFIKRKESTYLQTWHGTPLKKLALDMDDVSMAGEDNIDNYKSNFSIDVRKWDYLLSQNKFSTETFKRAFGFEKTILETGYPRNDALINNNKEKIITEIKNRLQLPQNKKVILYAPTWRDNEFYGNGAYKFSKELDFHMLKKNLDKEYIFIVKYHYLVKDNMSWETYKDFVFRFDMSYDIAELYLVSDMLITDYSSVMFDYSILRRPMLFFAYDLDYYKDHLRGFYFDFLEEAPGPITQTTQELIESIKNYNSNEYEEKYHKFCGKYNHVDNGKSSRKIVDLIEKEINL